MYSLSLELVAVMFVSAFTALSVTAVGLLRLTR